MKKHANPKRIKANKLNVVIAIATLTLVATVTLASPAFSPQLLLN